MIAFYADAFRTLGGWAWRARVWAHLHPKAARVLAVLLLVVLFGSRATAARAVGFLPEDTDYVDSAGNKFSQYSTINIDGGDALHPDKVIVNFFVQLIWIVQWFFTGILIWLFDFLLSFTWVQWLAVPFNTLAIWLQGILTEINWIPFALTISALVGGIAIFIGRVSGGLWEMLASAVIAVLAVGVLSNPVQTLTAAGGLLDKAQQFGGELASSIVVDEEMLGQTQETMSDAVTTMLMDIFIRTPYQVISYSMVLPEDCQGYFNTFIQTGEPQSSLRDCAPEAAVFSFDNPSAMNILNALINGMGVSVLNIFGFLISTLMIIAVFFFLVAAIKSMIFAYLAVAPINREPLWKAVSDSFMGLLSLVVMTVCLSLYLKLTAWIMAQSGFLPHQLRMVLLVIFMLVMCFLVWRARRATLRAGRGMASNLSKLGLGMRAAQKDGNALLKMGVVTQMAKTGYDMIKRSPKTSSLPAAPTPAPTPAPVAAPAAPAPALRALPAGGGHQPLSLTASRPPQAPAGDSGHDALSGGKKRPAILQKVARLGSSAITIGKGAVSGGVAGAATAAGTLVVQGAASKTMSVASSMAGSHQGSSDMGQLWVVPESPSSRFQVDANGSATVRRSPQVIDISSLPPRPTTGSSPRALERRRELESLRPKEHAAA